MLNDDSFCNFCCAMLSESLHMGNCRVSELALHARQAWQQARVSTASNSFLSREAAAALCAGWPCRSGTTRSTGSPRCAREEG